MRIKRALLGAVILAALCMACEQPQSNTQQAVTVSIAAIGGVTPPAKGGVPVTAITPTDQYTGTVAWNGNPAVFAASTAYTATISLTPKAGYTLGGVTENFFTVAGAGSVTNGAGSGTVTAKFPATAAAPVITINTQPQTVNVIAGSITGSLTVAASVTGGGTPAYQWYSNTSGSNTGGTKLDGETNASFTIPATLEIGIHYYFCEVSAAEAVSVHSGAAGVTVSPRPVITINTQPAANTPVKAGEISGSLSVTASVNEGAAITGYQWYSNTGASGEGGAAIDGATSANFAIPASLTPGEYFYFCEVTASGGAAAVRSTVATVTVSNPDTSFVIGIAEKEDPEPAGRTETLAGTDTVFSAGSGWASYQWYVDGVTEPGAITAAFTFNRPARVYNITVRVTDTFGDTWSGSCRVTVKQGA